MFDSIRHADLRGAFGVAVGSRFTPCASGASLLEAEAKTAGNAACGDRVLGSIICSNFGQSIGNHRYRRPVLCHLRISICSGVLKNQHYMHGKITMICSNAKNNGAERSMLLLRDFMRENLEAEKLTFTSSTFNQRQENE
jgi:hypothetical protein